MIENYSEQHFCHENDCATPNWEDEGCEARMCYDHGNASRCDGTKSDYYDNFFKEHEVNPFGDSNINNRKCCAIIIWR